MDLKKLLFKEQPATSTKPPVSRSSVRSDATPKSDSQPPKTSYLGDPTTRPRARSGTTISGGVDAAVSSSAPDPQFDAELKAALGQATSTGYNELMAQMEVLQDIIPDEGKRMQTALQSVVRVLHLTPEQIMGAIRDRLEILNQEKDQFESGIAAEVADQVAENQNHFQSLNTSIEQKDAEQRQLEAQLEQLKVDRGRMVSERDEVQGRIQGINTKADAVRARFQSAHKSNSISLKTLLSKIQPSGS